MSTVHGTSSALFLKVIFPSFRVLFRRWYNVLESVSISTSFSIVCFEQVPTRGRRSFELTINGDNMVKDGVARLYFFPLTVWDVAGISCATCNNLTTVAVPIVLFSE